MNLVGHTFGQYEVLASYPRPYGGRKASICRCSCGVFRVVTNNNLQRGKSTKCKSCAFVRHGESGKRDEKGSPEFLAWVRMRSRCRETKGYRAVRYRERGISVDPGWDSFEAFLRDMGRRPSSLHSLDRIDNDGGYSAGNCRWATAKEQAQNRGGKFQAKRCN